jgi:hypothetical protein
VSVEPARREARDALVTHYEALRRGALEDPAGGRRGAGWALVIGQGLAAWLDTCTAVTVAAEPGLRSAVAPTPLAGDLRSELALILARMALAGGGEGGRTT